MSQLWGHPRKPEEPSSPPSMTRTHLHMESVLFSDSKLIISKTKQQPPSVSNAWMVEGRVPAQVWVLEVRGLKAGELPMIC